MYGELAFGGRITMTVEKQFWGAVYGSVVDTFGVGWGIHYLLPE